MSGTAGTAYRAEITALQNYQKEILNTLDAMVIGNAALTTVNAVSSMTGGGQNNGLGTFAEAASLSGTYNTVMESMINNFKEITDLVTAMANVLGKSAQSYTDTEQQLTDQFNQIVAKYESQSGGFSTPGSPTATGATGTTPQGGTSNAYYSATPSTGSTTSTTTSSTSTTTSTGSGSGSGSGSSSSSSSSGTPGSISQDNNANASNDTSSEM
jgi:cobalamin biosynthesis Mg chelatase CobN